MESTDSVPVQIFKSAQAQYPSATSAVLTLMTSAGLWLIYRRITRKPLPPEPKCPKDTVLLYQFSRGPYCPSLSPFPLKLETYLRMAGIPYVTDLHNRMSSKGKIPWIRYNGQAIADSSFCISFLNEERGIDLNEGLTDQQRAVALAFQKLLEEDFYWSGLHFRWSSEEGLQLNIKCFGHPWLLRWFVAPKFRRQCHAQGTSRHSQEEICSIYLRDLKATSDYMGSNLYFLGDTPTEVDCIVFASLAQVLWHNHGVPVENVIPKQFPKLQAYCERMRQRFWPDWNECIQFPQTDTDESMS